MLAIITTATPLSLSSCTKKNKSSYTKETNTFSFNLPREIKNFDPLLVRGINQRYILFNIHRGLFYYNKNNKLTAHGAKACNPSKNFKIWTCELKKLKYHDKKEITAQDYINTFELIKENKEENQSSIKNIESMSLKSPLAITFKLKKYNQNFLHQLTNINLSPREEKKLYAVNDKSLSYSGPYSVNRLTESEILLTPNKEFQKNPTQIQVKGVFVDDSTTALNLYETKKIDFLRYLETSFLNKYENKILLSPHIKLDGIFLNSKIPLELRKKLTHSLEFKNLKIIFGSKGMPGCLELTHQSFNILNSSKCLVFNPDLKENLNNHRSLKISVPSINQKDHVRLAEWLKNEWKNHLEFKTEIEQIEAKIFYQKANAGEFSIYRRSVPLSELHCNHAKETLLTLPEFKNSGMRKIKKCSDFFKKALDSYLWIPLGLVHIPHLHASDYKGYYINALDQFGLENLERALSH